MKTLLVLAAGMGSRYGGLKQMDPVGPAGEFILDYSVYDALRAGFDKVVFVIRRDIEDDFRRLVGSRWEGRADVHYAFQSLDGLPAGFAPPAGRTKPWGTGHAILAARALIDTPFAVVNADDFYGAEAYRTLAAFFDRPSPTPPQYALVAYDLAKTLSEHGAVARGICTVDARGYLASITEHTAIARQEDGRIASGETAFPDDTPVSLNLFGFTPHFVDFLHDGFADFLRHHGQEPKSEYYMPVAVGDAIAANAASVRVLRTSATWMGVTYLADRPAVELHLASLARANLYPSRLY